MLFARYTGIGECFVNESNRFIFLWIIRSESARLFLGGGRGVNKKLSSVIVSSISRLFFFSLTSFLIFYAVMIPLYHYQHKHPHNFVFLGLFTLCLSFSIGVACANTQGLSFFQLV